MAALKPLLLAAALFLAGPAAAQPLDRWSDHITEAAARFGLPQDWIRRVIRAESGGRTMLAGRPITSRAGAMGLMQLMPGTWAEVRAAHRLGDDPHDPRDNILAGTAYLRAMYDRFGYPGLFAAYHAGPGRYADHLATGRRLPAETMAYVAAVGRPPRRSLSAPGEPVGGGDLFVARGGSVGRTVDPLGRPPGRLEAAPSCSGNRLLVLVKVPSGMGKAGLAGAIGCQSGQ